MDPTDHEGLTLEDHERPWLEHDDRHEMRGNQCAWDIPNIHRSTAPGKVRLSSTALSLFFVAAAASAAGALLPRSHTSGQLAPAAFVIGAFFLITAFVVQGGVARERHIKAEEDGDCENDCTILRQALNQIKEDSTLKGLAYVNFRQMRVFTGIAQRQARMSYYASLTAAAISLLVLVSGVAVTYSLTATPAKITAASLAAAGSALSGFLAATFLKTYAMASRQMSYYYGQPLVHCYLLHAEWLALIAGEKVHEQADRDLWNKVIEASIQASANAQKHLLSLQETSFSEARHRNAKVASREVGSAAVRGRMVYGRRKGRAGRC